MTMQVKDVAALAGVSIRTLHHYDAIGLLTPSSTTAAGYRLYTDKDLERLQQILFFKEIGFSLQEVKEVLDSPGFDRSRALHAHKELLLEKRERMERMIQTVERTIRSIEEGQQLETERMFDGFDMKAIKAHQEKYAEEARQLYGHDVVEAAERRVSGYSQEKWADTMNAMADIFRQIAARMAFGPADPAAQQAIEAWHKFITAHYYDCTLEIFRGLGDLYVADERFTANIDKYGPGLARFMQEAMHLYCDRLEKNTPPPQF